jgi:hypothetical protein
MATRIVFANGHAAATLAATLRSHVSGGELDDVAAILPREIRNQLKRTFPSPPGKAAEAAGVVAASIALLFPARP